MNKQPTAKSNLLCRLDVEAFQDEVIDAVRQLTYEAITEEIQHFYEGVQIWIRDTEKDVEIDWSPIDHDELECTRSLRDIIVENIKKRTFREHVPSSQELDKAIMPLVRLLKKYETPCYYE
jgi:hypothetical protein